QPFVTRNVDKAQDAAIRHRHVRKTQVDRDAARLFFLQPVRIDAGKRADQRGLAVVDMSGGADDHDTGSASGAVESFSARSISAADIEPRTTGRKGAASWLPPLCPRRSHISAATSSRGTPAPR